MPESGLVHRVGGAFDACGPLAAADSGYRTREPQLRMAEAVACALERRQSLVVEAGTGVGKTYAYLVPLLMSGCRALVSTATKSLQDQLFLRDLPRLVRALGLPTRLALLKGRSSYLCLHRLGQARTRGEFPDRPTLAALARVEAWSRQTVAGDLAELEGLDERAPVIPLVTSTRENCLGTECPQYAACHVVKARREAMAADVVVVNHHLFFADLALRDSGVAELLPTVDAALFDEAHQLVDAGLAFLGSTLGSTQLLDLAGDLLAGGLQHARGLRPWVELSASLEAASRSLTLFATSLVPGPGSAGKVAWPRENAAAALDEVLAEAARSTRRVADALEDLQGHHPEFERLAERTRALAAACARFAQPAPTDHVRWLERTAHALRLVESPLDIAKVLGEQRIQSPRAWIFTSATLGDDDALSWFTARTGLADATVLRLGSPFDHARQARLWIPRPFARPVASEHPAEVGRLAAQCARALGGRTFVLTTTLRVLPLIAEALRESARGALEVLVQGEQPRRALMARYADGRGKVLVGSHSFWEGIDVPGDALQCVVIDKLPFPPPNDPLVEARSAQVRARGGRPFDEVFVAEAAVALKQGAGRLIRTEEDRGLLVVCDPRLVSMPYAARLQAALPPAKLVTQAEEAWCWLRVLAKEQQPQA